jgi:hypothetical protein
MDILEISHTLLNMTEQGTDNEQNTEQSVLL